MSQLVNYMDKWGLLEVNQVVASTHDKIKKILVKI